MRVALLSCTKSPKKCHHWISHPWKPIKRGITWYLKLNGSQLRQIFIRECLNPRWPPKSKMAAENFGFSRLEILVWLISTTIQKIRLVPKCVTHADLSCRTIWLPSDVIMYKSKALRGRFSLSWFPTWHGRDRTPARWWRGVLLNGHGKVYALCYRCDSSSVSATRLDAPAIYINENKLGQPDTTTGKLLS